MDPKPQQTIDFFPSMLNLINRRSPEKRLLKDDSIKVETPSFVHIRKRQKPQKWSEQDTELFFTCLELFGMDFTIIKAVLSNKTLRQISRKFHKERKRNYARVNESLANHQNNSHLNENYILSQIMSKKDHGKHANEIKQQVSNYIKEMMQSENELSQDEDKNIKPLDFYLNDPSLQ